MCAIFIFSPYVATAIIGDPAQGLAQIADVNKWAGFATALLAPVLGAVADRAGARKGPLALVTVGLACLIGVLWFVTPDGAGASWFWLLFGIGLLFPLSEALHNAMLPHAADERHLSAASGLGLAIGGAASVLILLFALFFLALPEVPPFGLDPALHEPERIVGPIVAVWFAALAAPLFLWTRDTPRQATWWSAARRGVADMRGALARLRALPQASRFLLARMLYADAKTAIIVLGGVYAAGVMGWGFAEMAVYGVLTSTLAIAGGLVGASLDRRFGPKRAIQIELSAIAAALCLVVTIDRDTILFTPVTTEPVWGAPLFRTAPEVAFLVVMGVMPVFVTAAYASSRTMMALLAPREMSGELFGLYALSGAATAWLGPLLVSSVTQATQSAQAGMASLALLLGAGFALFWRLKPIGQQ